MLGWFMFPMLFCVLTIDLVIFMFGWFVLLFGNTWFGFGLVDLVLFLLFVDYRNEFNSVVVINLFIVFGVVLFYLWIWFVCWLLVWCLVFICLFWIWWLLCDGDLGLFICCLILGCRFVVGDRFDLLFIMLLWLVHVCGWCLLCFVSCYAGLVCLFGWVYGNLLL